VLEDEIGLRLAAPGEGWRRRGDMDPRATSRFRAGIVARSRFVEDLAAEQAGHGVGQYVILGAGLDTFAKRSPEIASRLRVFEVDRPGPQAWKRQRPIELGYGIPGEPVQLSVSWEPLGITGGTPVMLPEEGPHAGRGVAERMAVIGHRITHAEEVVTARPALADEAERLGMRPGATVLVIARTYHTAQRPVETADIVVPVERYELAYEIPVGEPPATT
jgi:hypothetical protein